MLLQDTEPLLPSTLLMTRNGSYWNIIPGSSQRIVRALDYVGDIINEEVGQLRKDKDHKSPVSGTAANEKENILPLQAEISEGASEKQASASSAFNENEDYIDSFVENEEAETESQTTIHHVLKLHKMEMSINYLTFIKLKQPNYQFNTGSRK
ncbi:hypothetical protein CU097_009524, partial [Rhizopus azygosporus]